MLICTWVPGLMLYLGLQKNVLNALEGVRGIVLYVKGERHEACFSRR